MFRKKVIPFAICNFHSIEEKNYLAGFPEKNIFIPINILELTSNHFFVNVVVLLLCMVMHFRRESRLNNDESPNEIFIGVL